MSILIEGVPVFYTDRSGQKFAKQRRLTLRDYARMLRKLHWDVVDDRYNLVQALLEKDTQRLKKYIDKYVKSESEKYHECAVFMKTSITVKELTSVSYIIDYIIFTELYVGEVKEQE